MTKFITHEWLIENGFEEYDIPFFESNIVDHFYQRCYKDNSGKKFFLNVKHWSFTNPMTGEDNDGYNVSGQFYLKGNHNAINIDFLDSDVDEAEEFIEVLFDHDLLDYYELWEA